MKCLENEHCSGFTAVPPRHRWEICAAIDAVLVRPARGKATEIRDELNKHLRSFGWSAPITLSKDSRISISSIKETTGLCIQTGGNVARMYADWLKLQRLYIDESISCGAMIVPSKPTAKLLGDNVVHNSRLIQELTLFNKVINMPLIVFSFE
jgi:hypothetical protein